MTFDILRRPRLRLKVALYRNSIEGFWSETDGAAKLAAA